MSLTILQWNPITDAYGDVKASIYIKPTLSLLEFANRNVANGNRTLIVQITGTDHPMYDGITTYATLDKTSDAPECRQNFYNATGLYLMTLSLSWFGYPNKNGEVTVYEGTLTDTTVKPQPSTPTPIPTTPSPTTPSPTKSTVENYQSHDNDVNNINNNDDIVYENYEKPRPCGTKGLSVMNLCLFGLILFILVVVIAFYKGSKKD